MTFSELFQLIEQTEYEQIPIKPGTYSLLRGSHNGNQTPSLGIYANGIHYTTDITTAQDFGSHVDEYKVVLKNPYVVYDHRKINHSPKNNTKQLLQKGYDSLVIVHQKEYIKYVRDHGETLEIPSFYNEYEVIILDENI